MHGRSSNDKTGERENPERSESFARPGGGGNPRAGGSEDDGDSSDGRVGPGARSNVISHYRPVIVGSAEYPGALPLFPSRRPDIERQRGSASFLLAVAR